jgi:WD40 repeat protein
MVRVWDLEAGQCRTTLRSYLTLTYGVAVTADGRRAVSGSSDETVRVWDVETGRCLITLAGHTDKIYVDYSLCLHERTDEGTLLVFPSYFRRERPELEDYPAALVSYQFSGALDEIYATLVVRLHHTTRSKDVSR